MTGYFLPIAFKNLALLSFRTKSLQKKEESSFQYFTSGTGKLIAEISIRGVTNRSFFSSPEQWVLLYFLRDKGTKIEISAARFVDFTKTEPRKKCSTKPSSFQNML